MQQLQIDFDTAAAAQQLKAFLEFVQQKQAEGYEARQMLPRICTATLKKGNHWIMTHRHKTNPAGIHISEWESTEPMINTYYSRFHAGTTYTRLERNWKLLTTLTP